MTKAPPSEPTTPEEWQLAVDGANALLVMKRARDRGWITDGPVASASRCRDILDRGAALGHRPNIAAVEEMVRGYGGDDLAVELLLGVANEGRA